jgi:aspartate aminotransferase
VEPATGEDIAQSFGKSNVFHRGFDSDGQGLESRPRISNLTARRPLNARRKPETQKTVTKTSTSTTPRLADRVASLQPSATLAMIARVKEMQADGIDMLDLTAGEPDFTPPSCAEKAGIEAIELGKGRYTPAAGLMELRIEVAKHIREVYGLDYEPTEIVVTHGAKIGIAQALLALVQKGDHVLMPSPCWTSYPEMVRLAEAEPEMVPCGENHLPNIADLEAARRPNTRAILLNSPCNPTGAVYPVETLSAIGKWALEHDIWVISDEIYGALVYEIAEHHSPIWILPALREKAVWIGGMSKAYAMTGWRMGFLAAPAPIAKAIASLQSQLAGSPSAISQLATLAALRDGDLDVESMRRAFEGRCKKVVQALGTMPDLICPVPEGAFYAFPRLADTIIGKTDPATGKTIQSGDDLVEVLIEADHVAFVAGSAFGAPDSFRISFAAADDVIEKAMAKLGARLQAIREN